MREREVTRLVPGVGPAGTLSGPRLPQTGPLHGHRLRAGASGARPLAHGDARLEQDVASSPSSGSFTTRSCRGMPSSRDRRPRPRSRGRHGTGRGPHEELGQVGGGRIGRVGRRGHAVGAKVTVSVSPASAASASRTVSTASKSGSLSSWRSRLYASGRPFRVASKPVRSPIERGPPCPAPARRCPGSSSAASSTSRWRTRRRG